jgi:transcriptional regulator with XRE-family HTH domain
MTQSASPNHKVHEGRNVKRFREMLGIKQDALAADLGDDWNQQRISLLEQKETIDAPLLAQISAVLKIPVEAIQNFDEEQAVNIIANTASFENCQQPAFFNHNPNFNPIDKVMELFERLLASEKEKVELMKEILGRMKS